MDKNFCKFKTEFIVGRQSVLKIFGVQTDGCRTTIAADDNGYICVGVCVGVGVGVGIGFGVGNGER